MSQVSSAREHQQHHQADSVSMPSLGVIEPVVDRVVEIARTQLADPITVKLWRWEDGEFKVRVEHGYPVSKTDRLSHDTAIQYHSRNERVTGYLVETDTQTDEERLLLERDLERIPDPTKKKESSSGD